MSQRICLDRNFNNDEIGTSRGLYYHKSCAAREGDHVQRNWKPVVEGSENVPMPRFGACNLCIQKDYDRRFDAFLSAPDVASEHFL